MDFGASLRSEFDRARRIDPSDLEQSKFRMILVAVILLGTGVIWIISAAPHDYAINANIVAVVYLLISIVIWRWNRKDLRGNCQLYLRCLSLVADVTAASVFIAYTGQLSVFILPVSITIIIGYGFRFGLLYSLAALTATIAGMAIAVRANSFLFQQPLLSASLFVSVIYAPIYSYYLLGKYRALLGDRNHLLEERESLMKTIAHEFRSPLHALIFLLDCARQQISQRDDSAKAGHSVSLDNIFEKASLTSERMVSLADRLLAVLVDQPESPSEAVNLLSTLREAFEICEVHARRRGIRLHWNLSGEIRPYAAIDRSILQDVVINVLDNSIKHTGGKLVICKVSMTRDDILTIHVRDSDDGVRPQVRAADRKDNSEVTRPPGGAGRAIIKRQLKRMGGVLEEELTEKSWHTTLRIPVEAAHVEQHNDEGFSIALHTGVTPLDPSSIEYLMTEGVLCRFLTPSNARGIESIAASVDLILLEELAEQSEIERLSTLHMKTRVPVFARLATARSLASPLAFPLNAIVSRDSPEDLARLAALVRKGQAELNNAEDRLLNGLSGLLVDDSEVTRLAIGNYLRKQGALLSVAGSLFEAKRQAGGHIHLDFVLLDVQLGNDNGLELVEYLRRCYGEEILVIILTGFSDAEFRSTARNAGADDVLLKSCSGDQLVTTLLTALKNRAISQQPKGYGTAKHDCLDRAFTEGISSHQRDKIHSEFMQKLAGAIYAADMGSYREALKLLHQVDGIVQVCGMPAETSQIVKEIKEAIANEQRVSDRILREAARALNRFLGQIA